MCNVTKIIFAVIGVAAIVPAIVFLFRQMQQLGAIERDIHHHEDRNARTSFRLNAISIRILFALLLILLVGLLLVGLELWRLNSAGGSSLPALEEVWRPKLADQEVQQQRHKELLDAIRETRRSDGPLQPDDTLRAKLSELKVAIEDFLSKLPSKPGLTPVPQPTDIQPKLQAGDSALATMDCGQGNSRRIGPFEDGAVQLGKAEGEKLDGIGAFLAEHARSGQLTTIMLIGSADKQALKPMTTKNYSSNEGLAQARITAVRTVLEKAFVKDKPPPMLESYVGSSKTDAKSSIIGLAADRVVQICVFWGRKP